MSFIRWLATALGLLLLAPSFAHAQDLGPAEAALLPHLDSKTISEVLALARQVDGWRKDIAQMRRALDRAGSSPGDPQAAADAAQGVLRIARRLEASSPFVREQIGFDEKIAPLLKKLKTVAKADLSPDDFPDVDSNDLRAIARSFGQDALIKQITDALDKGVLDRIKALRNPAQYADSFIQNQLKNEYFNKPYPFAGLTFTITQKDFSTSVFSDRADITIVVTQPDTGAVVKARGLYFKYRRPLPEPVTSKLKFETPGVEDLLALIRKYLPPIGPISIDKDVPVTVTPGKTGTGNTTRLGILVDFSELQEVGLGALKMKVNVAVSSRGTVTIDGASLKVPLTPPVLLGNTTLLITSVSLGLPAPGKILLGLTISTAVGEENTLYADISATVGFPLAREGLVLDGHLNLNKQPLAHVTGSIKKDGLTVSLDSDAITGGTGKLTVKGTLTKTGLDATAQLDSLLGLANARGQLHLGTDGNGSLAISSRASVGAAEVDTSLGGSFTPGFKNLTFQGAFSVDLADEYLNQVTAEVDFKGQLLPSPKIIAWGHIGPVDFPQIELDGDQATFNHLLDELKKTLTRERQQFYKFLADSESKASKYADQRTQVFAGWIYQNAKSIGLDRMATGNSTVDNALGNIAQGGKDVGGTVSQISQNVGKAGADDLHHWEDVASNVPIPGLSLTGGPALRSATISTGASGGFGFGSSIDHAFSSVSQAIQNAERRAALAGQLAPLTRSLDQVVVHKEALASKGTIAGLRMRTSRVLTHVNGDRAADLTLLVQLTSFRYTLDPKKGLVGGIARTSDLYVADITLHNLFGKGQKPTAEISFPAFQNVAPWDAASLLRDALMQRIDARLGAIQLTDRFEERLLYLQNLTDEPLTAHVQVETRMGQGWHWLPAGPGSSLKSFQVAVPARQTVPVHENERVPASGRRARIWASSPSGRVWVPYASRDVILVPEKDDQGQPRYYSHSIQGFRFWLTAPPLKTTTFHERLVSVRNDTRHPLVVSAEVAVRTAQGALEWEPAGHSTHIQPQSTHVLRHTHNLPMRAAAIRFRAEDDRKELYRWVHAWKTPMADVDPRGYSAKTMGATLLVLEEPGRHPSRVDGSGARDVTLHFPAEQVMVPTVKAMPLHKARQLLEEKGFRVMAEHLFGDSPVVTQVPVSGWEPVGTLVHLSGQASTSQHPGRELVPTFKGMTLAEAEAEGRLHHLVVKAKSGQTVPTRPTRDRALMGKTVVEQQEPAPATRTRPEMVVEVFLARYVPEKPSTPPGDTEVLVPSFKGLTLRQAGAEGKQHRLEVRAASTERVPARTTKNPALLHRTLIDRQEPAAATRVKPESTIKVFLIRYVPEKPSPPPGVREVVVPSLENLPLEAAETKARAEGLSLKVQKRINQPTRDPARIGKAVVEKQEPRAGTHIEHGSMIEIEVTHYVAERASTPPAEMQVVVPSFKGLSLAQAEAEGRQHHLVVRPQAPGKVPTRTTTDRALFGKTLVMEQGIAPGMKVPPESTISVMLIRFAPVHSPPPPPPPMRK